MNVAAWLGVIAFALSLPLTADKLYELVARPRLRLKHSFRWIELSEDTGDAIEVLRLWIYNAGRKPGTVDSVELEAQSGHWFVPTALEDWGPLTLGPKQASVRKELPADRSSGSSLAHDLASGSIKRARIVQANGRTSEFDLRRS